MELTEGSCIWTTFNTFNYNSSITVDVAAMTRELVNDAVNHSAENSPWEVPQNKHNIITPISYALNGHAAFLSQVISMLTLGILLR